MVVYHVKFVFR